MATVDVILLKDVEKLGKEGAVVHVKPGFARNYLLPRGLALPARPEQIRALEARQRQAQAKAQRLRKQADSIKQQLESKSLTVKLALGEQDKAFGAVTSHEIYQALLDEGIPLEKHAVQLAEPIKVLGIYDVPIRVHPDVVATLKLWVVKA